MFYDIPSWALRMDLWDLAGSIAYTLMYALIETFMVVIPFILIALLLPKPWVRKHWLPVAFMMMILASLLAFAVHANTSLLQYEKLLALIWMALTIGLVFLLARFPKVEMFLKEIVDRLTPLAILFAALDVVSMILVVIRSL